MKTHTVFTLMDGSKFDTIKEAKNHCDEMMGAELRNLVVESCSSNMVYKQMLAIVSDKKYDKEIFAYVAWRKELDTLIEYEKEPEYS